MKKTITKIAALFLVLLIFPTNNVCAGTMSAMNSRIPAQKTSTVVAPNIQTAKKLHSYLMGGASVTLKIQNKSSANRIISTLQEKIKEVNKQGVIFQHEKGTKKGRYSIYNIFKNDAKLYQYSVAFIKNCLITTKMEEAFMEEAGMELTVLHEMDGQNISFIMKFIGIIKKIELL